MTVEQRPQQLDLGFQVPIALDQQSRTAILTEAGFSMETTDPDAHLAGQLPISKDVFIAAENRALTIFGEQLADILEGF